MLDKEEFKMDDYKELRSFLLDDESKNIFDARIEYMNTKNINIFLKRIHDLYGFFQYPELESFLDNRNAEVSLVIFGAGKEGEIAFEILKHTKYAKNIYGFCDNNCKLWGKRKCGFPIFSVYELLSNKRDVVYILASSGYNFQFLQQLLNLYVPQNNIFIAPFNALAAQRGWQYFDMFQPSSHEIFVDAGAYDGKTSKDFLQWCQGKYDGIYMFELDPNMNRICFSNIGVDDNRIHFIGKGCWNQNTTFNVTNSQNSSHIIEDTDNCNGTWAYVCTLDSELENIPVTFIKMDIEGAEMNALQGAEILIKNFHPKLAISVYHNIEDMVKIMTYLSDLNPGYQFYLRHYSAHQWETVLYAISKTEIN